MMTYAIYWHRSGELDNPRPVSPVGETHQHLIFETFRARKKDLTIVNSRAEIEVWTEKHDRERELYDAHHRAKGLARELEARLGDMRSPTIEQMREVVSHLQAAIDAAKVAK